MAEMISADPSVPDNAVHTNAADQGYEEEVYVFPASFGQQRLWFLDQFEPGSPFYNIPTAVRLSGPLDVAALERSLNEIVRRHEALRTTFATMDGQPVQVIAPRLALALPITDLSELPGAKREEQALWSASAEARRPFNLSAGPLIRVHLLRLAQQEHIVLLTMHHIVSDGWSMGVFIQELAALYQAFSAGRPSPLPELSIQYADYADWQRSWLQGEVLEAHFDYWKAQLGDIPPVLELPTDRPRPAVQTNQGATQSKKLPKRLVEALKALSQAEGCTLFMTLLAGFQVLLFRYSHQTDISVGTPIANRKRAEIERLIGLFINTLVIRTDLSGQPSFRALLGRVREVTLGAFAHQDLPFEMLVEALQPDRDMSHSPLFQVMFILQNANQPGKAQQVSELALSQIEVDSGTATFDLTLSMSEMVDGMDAAVEYNIDLFNAATMTRLLEHFQTLLEEIVADPDQDISQLPIISEPERRQMLLEWNDTGRDYPMDVCIHQLFEAQVDRTPDAVAVVVPAMADAQGISHPRQQLTYRELNRRANQLARYLRRLGIGPEKVVGICVERSLEMIVGVLGVLKAGGAYLPLDPLYPQERLAFMLADSQTTVLLTQAALVSGLPEHAARVIRLDADWDAIAQESDASLENNATSANLVYMIYTSGTTGQSKGVMLEHTSLVNAYLAWQDAYRLCSLSSHLQMANFSFDVFSGDLVRALCSGGKLVLCPRDLLLAPRQLYELMRQEKVDAAEFVPAVLRQLIQYLDETGQKLDFMRLLVCGSDSWYVEEYRKFLRFCGPGTRLINSFGLTEATIDSSFFESDSLDLPADQVVPIGRPFPNNRLYILDAHRQPVPPGVAGELYVGGRGVARGYHNRSELTAEKFICNTFAVGDSCSSVERLYRTGDLARFLPDGNIEFLGRLDHQIKIRGFRIETGEIEAALRQHPAVQDAVVVAAVIPRAAGEDLAASRRLVAYLVAGLEIDRLAWRTGCLVQPVGADTAWNAVHTLDLSSAGLRLAGLPAAYQPGQRLQIKLQLPGAAVDTRFSGTLRWVSEAGAGGIALHLQPPEKVLLRQALKQLVETHGFSPGSPDAAPARLPLHSACRLEWQAGSPMELGVENFSPGGLRLAVEGVVLPAGQPVHLGLQLPGEAHALHLDGIVAWQAAGLAGVRFETTPAGRKQLEQAVAAQYKAHTFSLAQIRLFLKAKLPDYMVPSAFVMLDVLPLTPNGKIDRQALPAPDWSRRELGEEFVPPRTPTEELLASLWSQVLGVAQVGAFDNFFELGGHSLLATQVISRIRDAFQIELPLRNIFESPTIATLSEHIEVAQRSAAGVQAPPLRPVPRTGDLPLSFAQQRLWFLDQLEPDSPFYNLPEAVHLTGPLDVSALEQSLNEVVRRHEVLRTTFQVVGDRPVQVIASALYLPLPVVDLRALPRAQREAEALHWAQIEAQKPFDLSSGPLLRGRLIRLADGDHFILLTMHHICGDAWSTSVLVREIAILYDAFAHGRPSPLPPLPLQYADFAHWQRNWLQGEVLEAYLSYWKQQLDGLPPVLELPTDRPRPAIQTFRGDFLSFYLPERLSKALKDLCQKEGVTLFMLLLAAWQTLLYRYSGQDDVCVGTPIANRNRAETENLIGFFVNTLVLRANLSGEPSFREFLQRVRETALGAYAHQDVPFEMLVDTLQPERNLSHSPLFQVMFVTQNTPAQAQNLPGLTLSPVETHSGTAKFDMTLFMIEEGEQLSGAWEYNTDLFDQATIARMIKHFEVLLEGIVGDPDQPVFRLPLLTVEEKQQLFVEWNETGTPYPSEQCAHQLFEAQAVLSPDALAVTGLRDGLLEGESLTYAELNRRANQLANYLQNAGVGPETLVGICTERSAEMVIGLLGILKAGGAYVPLDPTYPAERLAFMIEDARMPVLLTQARLLASLPSGENQARRICLDTDWEVIAGESEHNPSSNVTPDNLAYVIYTSGSTGQPKGVMVLHRGLVNYLAWCRQAYPLGAGQGAPVHSSISFDLTVTALFAPLVTGRRVVLLPEELAVENLANVLMNEKDFSLIKITPAHLQLLGQQLTGGEAAGRTHAFIIGGENLTTDHIAFWQKYAPETALVNEYGPTETVVGCCVYWTPLGKHSAGVIPIGKPIINTQLYILDRYQQPVPVGVPGELYIGGAGVARGYLNRPDLTADRFVPNPFRAAPTNNDERLYRTGDLVRYLPDGNIECLGRIDFQVKIRGFRVELGEIESVLGQHPLVQDAVVWVYGEGGDKRLVAYIVPLTEGLAVAGELRQFLKERLPDYMVPAAFVLMDTLPLTSNGKVDRRALPRPDQTVFESQAGYVAPRTPEEEILAGIWAQVLNVPRVSVFDNFFDLGGHSLIATQVIARLRDVFDLELPLRHLFEAPTVAGLAEQCAIARRQAQGMAAPPILPAPAAAEFPLSFAQQRLWFLDQLEPDSPLYNIPSAVRLLGTLDRQALERSLNEIVRRHAVLRTTFHEVNGRPVQVITPELVIPLPLVDLSQLPETEREVEVRRIVKADALRPFNLSDGPLLRACLFRLGEQEHIAFLNTHHIISDDWSLGIFTQELGLLYQSYARDQRAALLPELPIQYADYARWQRDWLQGEVLEAQIRYWQQQLAGLSPVLELPTDRPRPAKQTYLGARLSFALPDGLAESLKDLSRSSEGTLFMVLLAAFQTLLYRYTGQEDISVGTPIANRTRSELEHLIGFFINTLVLRGDLSGEPSFRELLRRVHETALGAYAHQDVPFEMLVDRLQPERDLSHSPLFQVMLVLQNAPRQAQELTTGLSLRPYDVDEGTAKFDLTLTMQEDSSGLSGALEYNLDLFDAATIQRMVGHFIRLLQGIVADPDQSIATLALLSEAELHQVFVEWNDTQAAYPADRCVHELFETLAQQSPESPAVVFLPDGKSAGADGHGGEQRLTYGELNRRANQLAHHLQKLGTGPESLVGICVERSLEMVIGLLGILKAGGAYLPLDPAYPPDRLTYMLEDSQVQVLLVQSHLVERLPAHQAHVIRLDCDWPEIAKAEGDNLASGVTPQNLAYVIYTSGSTGRPKGVLLQHQGLCNLATAQTLGFGVQAQDRVLQFASFSFDASVSETFMALLTGATLYLAGGDTLSSLPDLLHLLRAQAITTVTLPPSLLNLLPAEDLPDLRILISAGEACSLALGRRWGTGRHFFNAYGPTEATIGPTYYRLEDLPDMAASVPVGRPIRNMQIYLLDRHLKPVPVGVPGEICIGGVGLARGYLNRPELTAEKFIPNPFSAGETAPHAGRLYRTGDLARYLPDGNLEYLGRIDQQVKLRGFRIELGEIEAVLGQHAAVGAAVVQVRQDRPGDQRLVAYIVPVESERPAAAEQDIGGELRAFLAGRLPDYMVPSAYVLLEALPLTPNGKVDRRALPAPEQERTQLALAYVAPRSTEEELLVSIWSQVLGVEQVGIYDNFFELGGHSLLATQANSRVRQVFQVELPLRSLFETPTVAGLAEQLQQARQTARGCLAPPILPVPRTGELPLSFAQQRLWFLDLLEPGSLAYNLPAAVRLKGRLNSSALERSLNEVVRRHEALRTTFSMREGVAVQVVAPTLIIRMPVIDLSGLSAVGREAQVLRIAENDAQQPFDLALGPLLRVKLLRLDEAEHVVLLNMHHIVSDGWSMGIFIAELASLYDAFVAGGSSPLPELPVQYADYAFWQRSWLQGEVLETELAYWEAQLKGAPPLLALPTDHPRPPVQTFQGQTLSFALPQELSRAVKDLSRVEGITLYMLLLAAFQALLARYTGLEDICVGTPIANRNHGEVERLIGFFVNTLVMRIDLSGEPSFRALLQRVREVALGAYTHQDIPFEMLVDRLQPERDMSHSPLFQVVFTLQDAPRLSHALTGLSLAPIEADSGIAKFDLTLSMVDGPEGLGGSFEFNRDLFEAETIQRMIGHFTTLLAGCVASPDRPVSRIPLLTEAEYRQILIDWNQTVTAYQEDRCVHTLFVEQARRTPAALAVVFEDQKLTYAELDGRSNQLARFLQRLGVGPETIVGICVERSLDMVVGMLGVLKAGGAYLPLDPTYPIDRLAFMLEDAQVQFLLVQEQLVARLPVEYAGPAGRPPETVICLDTCWAEIAQESTKNISGDATPSSLAYVIYTSGSTGRPKGVLLQHQGLVNFITAYIQSFGVGQGSRFLQFASFSFDAWLAETFTALLSGATLYLASRDTLMSIDGLGRLLRAEKITGAILPPSVLAVLPAENLPDLQVLVSAGEACGREIAERWSAGRCFFNGYGPTEATIGPALYTVQAIPENAASVPVGRPIRNMQIYLLDRQLQPMPVGVPGEICIGGVGLARGYLNRPELTAEKFIPNPFSAGETAPHAGRLYRTGDLARYLPDGNLEYLGRIDQQVKLRGFRIELGEIEAVLGQHAAVGAAVVQVRQDRPGDQRLVAYIVPVESERPAAAEQDIGGELRAFLAGRLPDYMVPSAYVLLEALPLTPNGKVDRRALPAPEINRSTAALGFIAPRDLLESQLAQIWEELLNIRPVGVQDNFFELGGHSLLAVRLVAQIEPRFGKSISLASIFQAPTIEQLAALLRQNEPVVAPSLVGLKPSGDRPPLFFIHPSGGSIHWYFDLAVYLDPDQPFYGLQAQGIYGDRPIQPTIEDMAAHYIHELRTIQPHGPYQFGSWSMGVIIAYEMAQQLVEQGEKVSFLAMLDQGPQVPGKAPEDEAEFLMDFFSRRLPLTLAELRQMNPEQQLVYVLEQARRIQWISPDITLAQFRHFVNLLKTHELAWRRYVLKPYPGRITVFRTAQQPPECSQEPDLGWSGLALDGVDVHLVEGDHNSMLHEPYVRSFARRLMSCIAHAAQESRVSGAPASQTPAP